MSICALGRAWHALGAPAFPLLSVAPAQCRLGSSSGRMPCEPLSLPRSRAAEPWERCQVKVMLPATLVRSPLALSSLHAPPPGPGETGCDVTSGKGTSFPHPHFLGPKQPVIRPPGKRSREECSKQPEGHKERRSDRSGGIALCNLLVPCELGWVINLSGSQFSHL